MQTDQKKVLMKQLWKDLAQNKTVETNLKKRAGKEFNVGFVNQYALHDFIPNKWFDWERRVDAKVMIIGQDWGPYNSLLPYIATYDEKSKDSNFDYDEYLFQAFSSRTEKFILNTIRRTYLEHYKTEITQNIWNKFFFTVAIFFTRHGTHFRGNEFYDEKFGIEMSLPYLKRQIEIVKPKIIMPVGGTAWKMIKDILKLDKYPSKVSDIIGTLNGAEIEKNNVIVIPNFHPASHTNPKIQYKIWKRIWKYF